MNKHYFRYGNYDLLPYTSIKGYDSHAVKGYDDIIIRLKEEMQINIKTSDLVKKIKIS